MFEGYVEYDEESLAWAGLGAAFGVAAGSKVMPKTRDSIKAGAGALLGLGLRALIDPKVTSKRPAKA